MIKIKISENDFLYHIIFNHNLIFKYNDELYIVTRSESGEIIVKSKECDLLFHDVTELLINFNIKGNNILSILDEIYLRNFSQCNDKNIAHNINVNNTYEDEDILVYKDDFNSIEFNEGTHFVFTEALLDFIPIDYIQKDGKLTTRRYLGDNNYPILDIDFHLPFTDDKELPRYHLISINNSAQYGTVCRSFPIYDLSIVNNYLHQQDNSKVKYENKYLCSLFELYYYNYDWGIDINFNSIKIGIHPLGDGGTIAVIINEERPYKYYYSFSQFLLEWEINGINFEGIIRCCS